VALGLQGDGIRFHAKAVAAIYKSAERVTASRTECQHNSKSAKGGGTARIAGGPSGRGLFSVPHRGEPLCFVRAAFQAGNCLLGDAGRVPENTPALRQNGIWNMENARWAARELFITASGRGV